MGNRTLYAMLGVVIAAMLLLFAINYTSKQASVEVWKGEPLLDKTQVKGMSLERDGKNFTLNIKQQTEALDYLSGLIPLEKGEVQVKTQDFGFSKLIIYRFNGADITLIPVAMKGSNIVFDIPRASTNSYMIETSNGKLAKVLSEAAKP